VLANADIAIIISTRICICAIDRQILTHAKEVAEIICAEIIIAAIFRGENTLPVYAIIICAGIVVIAYNGRKNAISIHA